MRQALTNLRVLITRPVPQSDALAALIREYRGLAVQVPTLEVVGVPADASLRQQLNSCAGSYAVIFISHNAVRHANAIRPLADLALQAVFAPGAATALALNNVGVDGVITPECGNDSESLLALPALIEVGGRQISIVRGRGGREELHDKLISRDACVDYIEVYRRRRPANSDVNVRRALADGIDAICVSSGEAMDNLLCGLSAGEIKTAFQLPLFTPSERVAGLARTRGFAQPIVAETPDDSGTINSLLNWMAIRKPVEANER